MTSALKQILIMSRAVLLGLPRRLAISAAMAFSVALAVCVLVGFLAMAAGFDAVLKNSGSAAVAVVLGGGTNQETGSDIPADAVRAVQAMRADIGVASDATGRPDLRDGIRITEGRMFATGARELAVGAQLAAEFPTLAVGRTVRLGAVDWKVVGHYAAGGSIFESEIWTSIDAVRAAYDRQGQIQTLRLRLKGPEGLARLTAVLKSGFSVETLSAVTEADLYAGQSSQTSDMIQLFGWPIAILMAFGATAGALNTMMSSVAERRREIATVRALGFSRLSAFAATWIEAIALALLGTAVGIVASWLAFNGWQASTMGANNTRMAFQLVVDGQVMRTVALFGLAIGLVGGFLPAVSATRIPLITALRAQA